MPSYTHEGLIEIFRGRPELVADLLAGPLGLTVPAFQKAQVSASDLTDLVPTEYRADAVVTLTVADKPVLAVVVEVQLNRDADKRRAWPVYVTTLYARHGCPAMLLVVCPRRGVAAWCAKSIALGHPGFVLTPMVLGPGEIPVVTDVAQARQQPELALLSTLAHGEGAEPEPLFQALLAALEEVDQEQADLYTDLVFTFLSAAARARLEELMTTTPHRYQSEFARRYFSQGEAAGEARGEAHGRIESLLAVLDVRGIEIPADTRATISACTDIDRLDGWIRRAVTAHKIEDVLG
jgi:hypothetical protein